MARFNFDRRILGICLVLVLVTLACYWPVKEYGFLSYDDTDYVSENTHVTSGLTWEGIKWAFQTTHASNWHPVTWISHMLDCQMFGLNAGPHHLVNVLLHIADSVLVFWLLYRLTRAPWRSGFVGALFAWHPLHVESVAWVAERKDVLSTLFWLLTMLAYLRYVKRPATRTYLLTLILFGLGLLAKPMVVTLPFVLLLLDFWPLRRWPSASPGPGNQAVASWSRLLGEKVPFLVLALASSAATCFAQQSVSASLRDIPLYIRVANAGVAYASYLCKTIWPAHLAAMYSFHMHLPVIQIVGAFLLLAIVTVVCVMRARQFPYLMVGWLWFLGTLVPVIGLVQVGAQSMADRYMYIPSIGLFVLLVWGIYDLSGRGRIAQGCLGAGGLVVLAGCLVVSRAQIRTWHDEETLFRHAIAVTENNYVACNKLAGVLVKQGREPEAFDLYARAVQMEPGYLSARYNFGYFLLKRGRAEEAAENLKAAVDMNPRYKDALINLAMASEQLGRLDEANGYLRRVIAIDTKDPEAYFNLGVLLMQQNKLDEATVCFERALELKPDYESAQSNLGVTLIQLGRTTDGMAHLHEAAALAPGNARAHLNLGLAFLHANQLAEAADELRKSLQIEPGQFVINYRLAQVLLQLHQSAEAIACFREAVRLAPDSPDVLDKLAWLLATDADAQLRSGPEAIQLARHACELTGYKQAATLVTLAAAYAEAGQFSDAVTWAQKAEELARTAGQNDEMEQIEKLLGMFQSGKPWRESF